MANRRMGGMGNRGGNRSFSQHQPFQGNVSPWQGNMSNNLNQGLINQLSNPQQLALALSSLLQPQQQQMNNPPSLLSLNASPGFPNQDHDLNRFGNRGRSDFRRHEPYNKNRQGGWRQQGDGNRNAGNRNKGGRDNKKRNIPLDKKVDDKKKEEAKAKKDDKSDTTIDLSIDEGKDEEGNEKKRDWKEEKNNAEEKKDKETEDGEENVKEGKDGKYFGVPTHLLHCFVCSKVMWDGESFQKHVRGRAHKQMLDSLEESFHITVNILRENMRLSEEKKMIELSRMHRLNKKVNRKFQDIESHCNMCDFKFLGKIMAHRKSEGHQRLKRFLHPDCEICTKEFPSRMEWVDHRLTPEHLRELADFLEKKKSKEDGASIVKEQDLEFDLEPLMDEGTEVEDENPILELSEDLSNLQNRIPAFRQNRVVGSEMLKPFDGFMCELCNTSFSTDDLAQTHLKSRRHYHKFIEAAKAKYQKQQEEEKEKLNEKKNKEAEPEAEKQEEATVEDANDSEMYDPEEACKEEEIKEEAKEEEIDEEAKANGIKEELDVSVSTSETTEDVKEEEEDSSAEATPSRPKRGNAKNGAGPKSKKPRK